MLKNLINSINSLISPVYEKFSKKKISSFENKINDTIEDKEIQQINFLICFIEQLFKDNKHLIESINAIENEKNEILNVPYIQNTIKKNDILKELYQIATNEKNEEGEVVNNQINDLISCIQLSLNKK